MIENSKQKFYENLGLQYKKGEDPIEPAKREGTATGTKNRSGSRKKVEKNDDVEEAKLPKKLG